MMFQCGLGAFSAAMLHIIAHSLYKSHAFLNSGSVLAEAKAVAGAKHSEQKVGRLTATLAALLIVVGATTGVCWLFGVSPDTKPGGWLLGLVLCLGLARWVSLMLQRSWKYALPALAFSTGLFAAYVTSFILVDLTLEFGFTAASPIVLSPWLVGLILLPAASVFLLDIDTTRVLRSRWYEALYVHGSNGFYVDSFCRRVTGHASR